MTVALRSLRVTADMDGRQYVAGMNQKIAADKAGAASSVVVGTALARTDAQADRSGGILARLSRQYIDGYSGAARFEAAVTALGRGIEKGAVPMERVEQLLDGIYRKYNLTASAADLAARGHLQLAAAATTLNSNLALEERALDAATHAHQRHSAAANDNRFQQRNLMFQLNDVVQSLALGMPVMQVALQQGPQIAQIYGPGEGGIGRAFSETGKMITGTISKFPLVTAAAVALSAAFAGMTYEINQTTEASVGLGDVALASLQVLGGYISDTMQPLVSAIAPWFQSAWEGVIFGVKWVGNTIINSFRAAFEDVKFLWTQFPDIMGAAAIGAANAIISAMASMIQKGADLIDSFANKANEWLPEDFQIGTIGNLGLAGAGFANPYAKDLDKANALHEKRQIALLNSDPLGEFYSDVRGQSIKNAKADEKKKGGKTVRESDYERTIRKTEEQTRATLEETRVIDLSTYAKERQAAVQDILTAAQRDGLPIGKAFANAQELISATAASLTPALAAERERILGVASAYAKAAQDAETAEEARKRFEENMRFARDLSRSFIDDVTGGLKEGMSIWDAFAKAATNALDKIASKLLDSAFDSLFDTSAGGGGILNTLFSGFFGGGAKADPWAGLRMANGGAFNSAGVKAFAKGGAFTNQIVNRPTYFAFADGAGLMGEAGPEAIMPLKRDGSGRLGVSASVGMGANQNLAPAVQTTYAPTYHLSGTSEEIAALRRQAERDRADFEVRTIAAVRNAQKRRLV